MGPSLSDAAGLQAGLHVATRLGGDNAAPFEVVIPRSDDLEIEGTRIAVFVKHPDESQQVDVTSPVGLVLRAARVVLPALAVPYVHVLDSRHHLYDRLGWVFTCPVNVRRVHVDAECRR